MKRFTYILLLLCIALLSQCEDALPQAPTQIKLQCPSPFSSVFSSVKLTSSGNITYIPCPTKSSLFYGIVDFTNATVIGLTPSAFSPLTTKGDIWGYDTDNARIPVGVNGSILTADSSQALGVIWATPTATFTPTATATQTATATRTNTNTPTATSTQTATPSNTPTPSGNVSGTGTTNFITRWTNGAGGVIGDTPASWNGTTYTLNVTALDCTFCLSLNPNNAGGGIFTVGNVAGNTYSRITEAGIGSGVNSLGTEIVNHNHNIIIDGGAGNTGGGGRVRLGDVFGSGASTRIDLNDLTHSIDIYAANGLSPDGPIPLGTTAKPFSSLFLNGSGGTAQLVTVAAGGNNRVITFPDAAGTVQLVGAANTGTVFVISGANTTITAGSGFTSVCEPLTFLGGLDPTESDSSCPVTRAGTIRNLYVRTGEAAKVNTPVTTITIRKNGVDTTVTLVMTETVSTTSSDTTHSFTVAAGDLITVGISVTGIGAISTGIVGITFELD